MTLPKKPPLVHDWSEANEKRIGKCRVCGATNRKIELAHVWGIKADTRDAVEEMWPHRGKIRLCRVATINPRRVVELCGPQQQPDTCHYRHDLGRNLELWDYLTDEEKGQAIKDAGGIGPAIRRCAPQSWDDRTEMVDGQVVEVPVDVQLERRAA